MTRTVRIQRVGSMILVGFLGTQAVGRAQADAPMAELHFLIAPSGHPDPNCFSDGQEVVATVHVGPTARIINGGQFVVEYDTSCLQFDSAVPGGSPYTKQIFEIVDEQAGTIVYAVGVELGGIGVPGDADLAVLRFTRLGDCAACILCFGGENPINTYLTDDLGQAVLVEPFCSEPIAMGGALTLQVPEDVEVEAQCDQTAAITWPVPTLSSACVSAEIDCQGVHVETGTEYDPDTVYGGGTLPQGTSVFCCAASDGCGAEVESCWTVIVHPIPPPLPEVSGVSKNRYLSLRPGLSERRMALRVTLVESVVFPNALGETRWVGPPAEFPEQSLGGSFPASELQCTPYFHEWSDVGLLHAYGAVVVPGSVYAVEAFAEGCDPTSASSFSEPLLVATAMWGDVAVPVDQLGFSDIVAVVDRFRDAATALPKVHSQLQPNVPNPANPVNLVDVGHAVDAFRNLPYPFAGPGQCP